MLSSPPSLPPQLVSSPWNLRRRPLRNPIFKRILSSHDTPSYPNPWPSPIPILKISSPLNPTFSNPPSSSSFSDITSPAQSIDQYISSLYSIDTSSQGSKEIDGPDPFARSPSSSASLLSSSGSPPEDLVGGRYFFLETEYTAEQLPLWTIIEQDIYESESSWEDDNTSSALRPIVQACTEISTLITAATSSVVQSSTFTSSSMGFSSTHEILPYSESAYSGEVPRSGNSTRRAFVEYDTPDSALSPSRRHDVCLHLQDLTPILKDIPPFSHEEGHITEYEDDIPGASPDTSPGAAAPSITPSSSRSNSFSEVSFSGISLSTERSLPSPPLSSTATVPSNKYRTIPPGLDLAEFWDSIQTNLQEVLDTEQALHASIEKLTAENEALMREKTRLTANLLASAQWTCRTFSTSDRVTVVEALTDLCALHPNPYDWRQERFDTRLNCLAESVGKSYPEATKIMEDKEALYEILARVLHTFLMNSDGLTVLPKLSGSRRRFHLTTNEELRPYIPDCILWVFVHTADHGLLRVVGSVLAEYIKTCEGTPRGVQVQLLQSRVTESRLQNREKGGYAWRLWAFRQKFLAAKNGWDLDWPTTVSGAGEIPDITPPDVAEVRSYWPKK